MVMFFLHIEHKGHLTIITIVRFFTSMSMGMLFHIADIFSLVITVFAAELLFGMGSLMLMKIISMS